MKPILFNSEMVRAILDGRKRVTRRIIKWDRVNAVLSSPARKNNPEVLDEVFIENLIHCRYRVGGYPLRAGKLGDHLRDPGYRRGGAGVYGGSL